MSKHTFFADFSYKAFISRAEEQKSFCLLLFLTGLTDHWFLGRSRTQSCLKASQKWGGKKKTTSTRWFQPPQGHQFKETMCPERNDSQQNILCKQYRLSLLDSLAYFPLNLK